MAAIIAKIVAVLGLTLSGVFFLLVGAGAKIPSVKFKGFEAFNLPAGFGLLLVAFLIGKYWKVSHRITTTGITETRYPDGTTTTTTEKTTYDTKLSPPGGL